MTRRAREAKTNRGRHKSTQSRKAGNDPAATGAAVSRTRWGRRWLIVGLILLGTGAGIGWWPATRGWCSGGPLDGRGEGFNILLITLDTTRADSLGCYGHPVVKTPNIDALARDGVLFKQCMATAPVTLPSHASIMTGTYPFVHRARNNGRYLADEGNLTLAEALKEAGYSTAAEVGAYVLDAVWGIDQGFESYRSESASREDDDRFDRLARFESEPGNAVTDRALDWLDRNSSASFFLWVHFFDPHDPYEPPAPFSTQYEDPYLGEIAFVDQQVGRLMNALRRRGDDDNTLVVVTADHGEGRGQHQEDTHAYYVYDSTMLVPLVLWCPPCIPGGRRIDVQVRTVDIAPTVLALVGSDARLDAQGTSLLPLLDGRSDGEQRAAYGESITAYDAYGYARLRTYRADGWKYIHAPQPELYDIRNDPSENTNLARERPEQVEQMRGELEELIAASVSRVIDEGRASGLDAEAARKLAALGYVWGYAPEDPTKNELELFRGFEGPDPKDHIVSMNRFITIISANIAGQHDQAEPVLRELIAAEPAAPAFREYYALVLRNLGRLEEAMEQYRALLELRPEHALAHYQLGRVCGGLGRLEESLTHLQRAAEAMPEYPDAHVYLAHGLAEKGELAEAEKRFRAALALDPANGAARLGLSSCVYQQGRQAEAVQVLREGLSHRPDSPGLVNNLAWYLATLPAAELRDGQEAVRLAESLIKRYGENSPGLLDTLAAAYAEAGRFEEAASTARHAANLAEEHELHELANEIRERMELYDSGKTFREVP